tara:strand:- start:30 stop:488 length:459 start_codon:yes stop_codon:yes gene_type:complete
MNALKYLLLLVFLISGVHIATAAINETQALTFGEFALSNNASSHQLTISPLGVVSKDQAVKLIVEPEEAVFDVSGFPGSTPLIINVSFNNLTSLDGGSAFTISNPSIWPAAVTTDPAGNATFNVGATLRTSGDGGFYPDSNYNGTMTVSVNF